MVSRESCNKMALRCCTSTEMRWYKKLASLGSPVMTEILKLISFNRLLAEKLKIPLQLAQILTAVKLCIFPFLKRRGHIRC